MYSHEFENYHEYLKNKSLLGDIYRSIFLYPRLASELSGKTLDIGCGTGEFARYRTNTDGADINPFNVEWLAKQNIRSYLISDNKLPIPSDTYDSAIMDNVLEHIDKPEGILEEANRILKDQGTLLIGVPGIKGFHGEVDHKIFYDEALLTSVVEKKGFKKVKAFYTPFKSRFLNEKMRQYCLYGVFRKI